VRKTEPKPLRVFLQDGSNDLDIPLGSWWMANQSMLSALQFGGYEVEHVWGEGYHGQKHGGAIFPQAMKWLWKDHKKQITTHYKKSRHEAKTILAEASDWELISEGHGFTEGPAVSPEGILYFSDLEYGLIHKINENGKVEVFWDAKAWLEREKIVAKRGHLINGLAFNAKGELFGCSAATGRVLKFNLKTGEVSTVAKGLATNDIVIANNGRIYVTEPKNKSVWMIEEGQTPKLVSNQFSGVNGITLNEDQSSIYVADYAGRYVWFAQLRADGLADQVAPHHHLHLPITTADTRGKLDGMCIDDEGRLYTATAMGVQVSNWNGLVTMIMPPPVGARHPANVTFGGKNGHVLYATC
jgi:sugar lactone lactonase YvrE